MAQRTCDVEGCGGKHLAKGWCARHYRLANPPQKNRPVECPSCGKVTMKRDAQRRFCSLTCRDTWRAAQRRSRQGLVHVGPADPVTMLPPQHPVIRGVAKVKQRTWYCGACAWCGTSFVDWQPAGRYCSPRCYRNAGKARRGRFLVPPHVRVSIYVRDNWVCQLCMEPVDPDLMTSNPDDDWAPSLDHIHCQSWTDEPDHSPSNLRLAHRWCNAVRGDGRWYTEADLRAS